jgi:predicted transposase YbfD/YdcC
VAQTEDERVQAKQAAQLSVAPRLLAQAPPLVRGRLLSGDALYCQKALCRQIRQAGGDYLLAVKGNQPNVLADVTVLFQEPPLGERFLSVRTVTPHGGRLEVRQLRASASLASYLCEAGWADVGLVLEVATTVCWPRHPATGTRHEVRYFLSSLPAQTPPTAALALVRQRWHSENRLHWPRDVTFGEDACQVRSGRAPQALAAVRTAVVGVLHQQGVRNLAATLRANAWSGAAAVLAFLGLKL